MASIEDFVAACSWMRQLSAGHAGKAREGMFFREFRPGAYVARKGDRADAWIGVAEGLVKLTSRSAAGKSVTFAGIPAGSWFGEGYERLGQLMAAKEHAWLLTAEGRVAAAIAEMYNPALYPGTELSIGAIEAFRF